jgi:hypothetical protein
VRGAGPHPSGGMMSRRRGVVARGCSEAAADRAESPGMSRLGADISGKCLWNPSKGSDISSPRLSR